MKNKRNKPVEVSKAFADELQEMFDNSDLFDIISQELEAKKKKKETINVSKTALSQIDK